MDGLECSEIKKSELEFSGRTDAEYYQKKFLQYQNIIEAHNILPLSKVADFLIGPFGSAYDQVLNYRDELQKNFSTLTRDLEEADTVRAFSPKCVVVIGKISTLNAKQQKAFELYRSSFNNLTIITFDELHQKICDLMSVFKEDSPRPVDSLMDEFSIIDEDYPI